MAKMASRSLRSLGALLLLSACASGSPPAGPAAPAPGGEPGAEPGTSDPSAPVQSSPGEPPAVAEPAEPGGHFPGSSWKVHDMGVAVPDEWRTCGASSECTLVVTTCCDQCNGGKAVAVNAAHAKQAEAKFPKSCASTACTERGCFTRAACQSGRCVMEWESASP